MTAVLRRLRFLCNGYTVALLMLFCSPPLLHAESNTPHTDLPAGLINDLEKLIQQKQIPGIAVGIVNGSTQQFIGLGSIRYDKHITPTRHTRYELGSISKVFTSLLVQTLVDKQQISWNDTLDKHIHGTFASSDVSNIQLKQLATHRSGLHRVPKNRSLFRDKSDPYNNYSREDLYREIRNLKPGNFFSRLFTNPKLETHYQYSNLGAGILGQIAADLLTTDYSKALTNNVLKPLSLQCTDLTDEQPLAPAYSDGQLTNNWHFQSMAGAGGIRSCIDDMLKFVASVFVAFDNHHIHNKADTALVKSIAKTISKQASNPETGLAWLISQKENRQIWWHNGGTGGYTSILLIEPATSHALILLTNSDKYKAITKIGFKAMRTW